MSMQAQDALDSTRSFWFMVDLRGGWIPTSLNLRDVHTKHPSIASKLRFAVNSKHPILSLPEPEAKTPSTGWLGELYWISVHAGSESISSLAERM